MKTISNIRYNPNSNCVLDIRTPDKPANCSVLIYVPGGGFSKCDIKQSIVGLIALQFIKKNVILVAVTYQVLPKAYPTQDNDLLAAVTWIRNNISKYGGNSDAMFLLGHSAGAVITSMSSDLPEILPLKGVINVEGAYDFKTIYDMEPKRWKKALAVFPGKTNQEIFDLSPINHITDNLPPELLIYADSWPWTKVNAVNYSNAILEHGRSSTLYHAIGKTHTSVMTGLAKVGDLTFGIIMEFISR